jgi:hypothetical protein
VESERPVDGVNALRSELNGHRKTSPANTAATA